MKYLVFAIVGLLILSPATVQAQYNYGYPSYGFYDDYYGYGSSTAQEGYGRGLADIIRSQGIFNRLSADAHVKHEEARREHIENYREGVETYFHTRELNRAYRAAEQAERRESVREWQKKHTPYQPRRLSPSELEQLTGGIIWPILLKGDAYSKQRETLDRTFRQWADRGRSFDFEGHETVLTSGDQMLNGLKEQIRDTRPTDYLAAKRFIQALMNEAKFPISR